MSEDRIHRAVSADGTEIAGRVHGKGPPLVLVHGALADGDTSWTALLPLLTDHYTCYAMSLRGRGLSGQNDDLSGARLVQDVVAFTESIGKPTRIVGLSSGALMSLAAAEHTKAIVAVAAYEPPVFEVMSKELFGAFRQTIDRMGARAGEGRLTDSARTFVEFVSNDEELAAAAELHFFDDLAPNVAVQLKEFPQVLGSKPSPTDPAELAKISVPVLLLRGTRSTPHPWFADGVRHVARYVTDARVREIAGAGHLGPIFAPGAVANELRLFFAGTERRAA